MVCGVRTYRPIQPGRWGGSRRRRGTGHVLGFLSEQIVGDAQRHFAAAMQFLNHRVILWVILEPAPCINDARQAEPVYFAHEVAR